MYIKLDNAKKKPTRVVIDFFREPLITIYTPFNSSKNQKQKSWIMRQRDRLRVKARLKSKVHALLASMYLQNTLIRKKYKKGKNI